MVRAQLAEFAMVQEAAAAYGTPDFASQLGASSLQRHALELQAELKAAEHQET